MTRGALALIMHSCEMPQGNYWGEKTAIAAIEALSSLDYVGIITFDFGGGGAPCLPPLPDPPVYFMICLPRPPDDGF